MACRLLDAMPFHEPMQTYCSMDLLNKLYERIWYEPFIAYVWHCQGCIEVYCLFKLVKIDTCDGLSPDQWRAITWTTADLLFIETFWTNSGFTLLKPSLLWFATFKKTSLSGNHTARPLCGDHTGLVGSLHRDQQCVSLGVSLNKFYDVIEVISVLLVPCAGNPQTSGFPSQMVGSGDFLLMFKLLNKQLKCHRSQNFLFSIFTLMWRHCNVDPNIVWPVYDLYSKIFRNILKVQNWKKNHCVQAGACVDL